MSLLDSSLHDVVAGGYVDPDRLPFPTVVLPFDHPSMPTCPFHPFPSEA